MDSTQLEVSKLHSSGAMSSKLAHFLWTEQSNTSPLQLISEHLYIIVPININEDYLVLPNADIFQKLVSQNPKEV